jgi:hypothetical protein
MGLVMIALLLGVVLTAPASAAPGDPRFVQGTLEWPPTLTREPVVIVRGDDGHAYYCDVTEAARHRADDLRAGGRVSVLGLEANRSHEITGLVIGTGDTAALARALSQGLARTPSIGGAVAAAPAPVAAPPPSAAPALVIMAPGSVPALGPGQGMAPSIIPATGTVPAVAAIQPPPRPRIVPMAPPATGGRGQWSRLDGMVESVAGSTLTLKTDDGALAYVDISQLSPNVAQVLRHGTTVTLYGYPLEQTFQAAGYIQTNPGGAEPRASTRTTR